MTKKILIILLLIALFTPAEGFCWFGSFRLSASGSLLYGDFDNDLDPIYIWDNDGYRLYTTMSNLSSQNDMFFQDTGDGVYLIGSSGNFGIPSLGNWESRSMFLVQLADTRGDLASGLDTDYNGTVDLAGNGFMSGDFTQYFDNNNDNIFDARANYLSSADNFNMLKKRDWHITHSYRKGDRKFGFAFNHLGYGNNYSKTNSHSGLFTFVAPSHNFSYSNSMTMTDLSSLNITDSRSESGDFGATLETPANIFTLSYEMPFSYVANSEIRFDITIDKSKDQYNLNDGFNYFRDVSGGGAVDVNQYAETVAIDSSLGGTLFSAGALVTKHWNTDTYSWFRLSFGMGSYDANKTYSDRFDWTRQLTDIGGNTNVTVRDYDEDIIRDGDTKRKEFDFYHKTVVDFTERFTFAAGVDFFWISDKTDWSQDYTLVNKGSFDNGDGISDHNDSTFTITNSFSSNLVNEMKSVSIQLPVAMEYTLGRWVFRLGATHSITRLTVEENGRITSSTPQITTIIYGDNDTTVTVADDEFLSTRTATESRVHATHFLYGLQFNANEHLKAELLAFFSTANTEFINSNFYRQLRLSLTVLF